MALDEHRARFRPKTWYEATLERELDLDADDLDLIQRGKTSRDDWIYTPFKRDMADVEEVWFSGKPILVLSLSSHIHVLWIGSHADLGGGSHHSQIKNSLSFIPLKWMIKEAIIAGTGILFRKNALKSVGFDFMELASELDRVGLDVQKTGLDSALLQPTVQPPASPLVPEGLLSPIFSLLSPIFSPTSQPSMLPFVPFAIPNSMTVVRDQDQQCVTDPVQHFRDAISKVYDPLSEAKYWWILEIIPMLTTCQEPTGDWTHKRV